LETVRVASDYAFRVTLQQRDSSVFVKKVAVVQNDITYLTSSPVAEGVPLKDYAIYLLSIPEAESLGYGLYSLMQSWSIPPNIPTETVAMVAFELPDLSAWAHIIRPFVKLNFVHE